MTVMLNACVADCATPALESVTFTVKLDTPAVVGVPVIAPVLLLRLKPAGKLPEVVEYVRAPAPPVTAMLWLYAVPTTPAGSVVVVIAGGALTVMLSEAAFVVSVTDVAVIVADPVPDAGALYVADVEVWLDSVPGPVMAHVTPLLCESLATVAVTFTLCPWSMACEVPGERFTEIGCTPAVQLMSAKNPAMSADAQRI